MDPIAVIGMGRFAQSLIMELASYGVEILGIDPSVRTVHEMDKYLTDAIIGDGTDIQVLRDNGLDQFSQVVVGIGSSLEASILTASNLVELEVPSIWAKAVTDAHARILSQIGVHHVVRPERDTGRRVAHLLHGRYVDVALLDEAYEVIKLVCPKSWAGNPVDNAALWKAHRIHVVSVKAEGSGWHPVQNGQILPANTDIIVGGAPTAVEKFAEQRCTNP